MFRHNWMPYHREVLLHEQIIELRKQKVMPSQHPIFDMLPELSSQVVDAVYSGADKVRTDLDAEAFAATVKINGSVHPEDARFRLENETKIKCEVKSCMYESGDKSVAPVDRLGRVIPPNERAKHTPLGRFMDGEPDAVIYAKNAA